MALLDDLKSAISRGDTGQLQTRFRELVGGLDLDSLKQRFEEAGLGEKVRSWIGTGDNEPVSADEVKQAMGEEQLRQVAERQGTDVDTAAQQVADTLPDAVDRLTPEGRVPSER